MVPGARRIVWRWGQSCGLGTVAFTHADQIRLFPRRPPGSLVLLVYEESEAAMAADKGKADGSGVPGRGGDGAEVAEDSTQVVEYAAAIDVAKGFGMVCTRVPGTRPDRRRQKVWRVEARFNEVTALMDHLRAEGIQRLVLESTSDYVRSEGA